MKCSTCLNRWLRSYLKSPAKWHCRQGAKETATVIGEGTDEDLKNAKGCRNYKNSLNNA